jgi:hypothetical protein
VINQTYFGILLSLAIMVINTIFIWFRNLEEFFGDEQAKHSQSLYIVAICIQLLDSGIKIWFLNEHNCEMK